MTFQQFLGEKLNKLFVLKKIKNTYYVKNEFYRSIIEYVNILYIAAQLEGGRNVAYFSNEYYSLKKFKDKILKFIPEGRVEKHDRTRVWLKNGAKLEFFNTQMSSYKGRRFDIAFVNNYSFNNSIISELFCNELIAVY